MEKERQNLEANLIKKAWESAEFKQQILTNPKAVVEQEIGQSLPDDVDIKVVEETDKVFYFRLPINPDNLPEAVLDLVAAGGSSNCKEQCNNDCADQCVAKGR